MATALALGALLGAAVSKLSDAIIHVTKKTWYFKSELTRLQETITRIEPTIKEIRTLTEILNRPVQEREMFINQMKGAKALILKCERIEGNLVKRYTHALKLDALNASMLIFFQFDVPLAILRCVMELERMMKRGISSSSTVPLLKGEVIGFEDRVTELKAKVLNDPSADECSVVVVSAGGGFGKTTLVTKLCHDPEIKAKFGRNIYFVTISEIPNLKIVIKNLLNDADFVNDDDAIKQWGGFLNENESENILLVLDDVWSESIINRFKFKHHGYKILATSRTTFTQFNTYQLQLLYRKDATKLFTYYSGLLERRNKDIPDDLVDKLVKCCKEHPLALEVIGGLLKGQHIDSWNRMLNNLSDGKKSVLDLQKFEIEHCLARSLDILEENSEIKECFLDLGLFPEDQKISATMLMDICVHLYNDDEEGLDTIIRLRELSYKNLATLLPIRENPRVIANKCEERAITQHDLMRTLSIRSSSKQSLEFRKRLIVNAKGEDLPQSPLTINAILLSMSTDEIFSINWNNIQAPKVEVFVLNFMSKIHPLPQVMQTMKKLKILIITNYGYNFSNLQNFPSPQYVTGLKTIRLEHVSISSISKSILELGNLRKLSLIMCEIGNSFNEYISNKLTTLLEINIDSCDDLITFPSMFCNLIGLRKLTITNCHELSLLSEELGNLINLEVLRLASCTNLTELPESMRNFQKLRVIDISDCLHLKKLPERIGELGGLRTIHMRGCTGLHELPSSVKDLGQLQVFCDEEVALLWRDFTNVNVHLVEEDRIGTLSKITQNDIHV